MEEPLNVFFFVTTNDGLAYIIIKFGENSFILRIEFHCTDMIISGISWSQREFCICTEKFNFEKDFVKDTFNVVEQTFNSNLW